MKIYFHKDLTEERLNSLTKRNAIDFEKVLKTVKPILEDVKKNGLEASLKYAKKFDGFENQKIKVTEKEFAEAEKNLDSKVKKALKAAAKNIEKFHIRQFPKSYEIETMKGIKCSREFRQIENVGLYIPGGNAVLPSTMLMLGIPAKIAGCKRAAAFSPAENGMIHPALLYAAKICKINEFYKIGGAQAIALMAYGGKKMQKVDKIFGPGNQYVTAAKMLVSIDGCAIDMPAGPSEVLIIADENTKPAFAASDLLAQAEHGPDSQTILVCTSNSTAEKVNKEIQKQMKGLPRKYFARKSLANSFILIVENIDQAFYFSNKYAPEHLIINLKNAKKYKSKVINAGSVFLGQYSPESAGDYASGTNHSLPTSGFAKAFGGVSVESFMKAVTFQKLDKKGLKNISSTVKVLAETEGLIAHKNSIEIRL